MSSMRQLVYDLEDWGLRRIALHRLAAFRREWPEDLAPLLWSSPDTIQIILKEIESIHPFMSPPRVPTSQQTSRACDAIELFSVIASHDETMMQFFKSGMLSCLIPFIKSTNESRDYECLRFSSLTVLNHLAKAGDSDIIRYLLSEDIFSPLAVIMRNGNGISREFAALILRWILESDFGLSAICKNPPNFYRAVIALERMSIPNPEIPPRMLQSVFFCYIRLARDETASEPARMSVVYAFRDESVRSHACQDPETRQIFMELLDIAFPIAPMSRGKSDKM